MENQVVPEPGGKLTKSQIYLLAQIKGQNIFEVSFTYSTMLALGPLGDPSRGWESNLSHDRFVGFRSIRQKRRNDGAQ